MPAALVARRRAGPDPRAAPAGAADADRGRCAWSRRSRWRSPPARSGSVPGRRPRASFWRPAAFETRGGIIGAGRALGRLAPVLDARRPHPRRVPVRRRADPGHAGRRSPSVVRATGAAWRAPAGRSSARPRSSRRPPSRRPAAAGCAAAPRPQPRRRGRAELDEPEPLLPPEPDTAELIVRATHVEAPPIEAPGRRGGRRAPAREREAGRAMPEAATERRSSDAGASRSRPEDLTPQGRYRASITDDPDFVWRVPGAAVPDPLDRRGGQARHRRPGAGRADAARDARPLRDRGEGDRPRHRPAHHPLRAAPRARAPRSPRSRSSRTTSRTRSPPPTSGSSRRSRASRRSASRSRTRGGGSSTSATSSRSRRRTGRR